MKIILILYLLIIIFICCCFLIFTIDLDKRLEYEKFENINIDIGNRMSGYFFNLGSAILQKQEFKNDDDYNGTPFFENLPKHISYNSEEFDNIHDAFISENIDSDFFISYCNGCNAWEIINNKIYHFWKIMRPLVHSIMDETFLKSNLKKQVDYPIIHFRCADTPFIKQNGYHLQYYKFFKTALDKITDKSNIKYSKVILMSCNTHNSNINNQTACVEYTDSLKQYLNEIGYECDVMCGTNIDDFAMLFYAPAVISTSSSFSFMSGFFGKGVFLISDHTIGKCTDCAEVMLDGYNLMHENIEDYLNTNDVIQLLRK